MNIYEKKQRWKLYLLLVAFTIGVGSLLYTNRLVKDLAYQEKETIKLWAEATKVLINSGSNNVDLSFPLKVIQNNTKIPVILTDTEGQIITWRNLDSTKAVNNPNYLLNQLKVLREENDSLYIDLGNGDGNVIFYGDSIVLKRLLYFPFIQLGVIILFILVSYFAFSSSRKAEQNKVWVGLSKETAHQLGTPTSSLNGWVEILKQGLQDENTIRELSKDVKRLEKITERFSKIGSRPVLERLDINQVLRNSVEYLTTRSSEKIIYKLNLPPGELIIPLNEALFEWVIENVCKNAIDAVGGKGEISIDLYDNTQILYVDIKDKGKGVPKAKFKTIFKPGYTTKKTGWGLGLSLSKRIIEYYHEGKIFVLNSDPGSGTTIRIVMKK
ncbi:MAG: HAMP domain-containing histidine kinase [Bacteroidales bacterium]|nr:HAMP domain-containing histidine kinase [Bacteroidales bacterium]MCF8389647.1 HAMP domain-containing histidine kinase [Bacteroidales bacterium]